MRIPTPVLEAVFRLADWCQARLEADVLAGQAPLDHPEPPPFRCRFCGSLPDIPVVLTHPNLAEPAPLWLRCWCGDLKVSAPTAEPERLFLVDQETGEACPTDGPSLCVRAENHRHRDGRPAPTAEEAKPEDASSKFCRRCGSTLTDDQCPHHGRSVGHR